MVSYIRPGRIYLAMWSYCLYRALRPLRKGRSGVLTSTDFKTMASHDAGAVYFIEYLSVLFQLTYLDKLYGECNGTARIPGALLPNYQERLGMRLVCEFGLVSVWVYVLMVYEGQ